MERIIKIDKVGQVIHAQHIERIINKSSEYQYTKAELMTYISTLCEQVKHVKKGYWINIYSCTMLFSLFIMLCLSIFHMFQLPNIFNGKTLSGSYFIYFFPTLIILFFSQALFEKKCKLTKRRLNCLYEDIEFFERLLRRGQYK